jgi:hypothetical protein
MSIKKETPFCGSSYITFQVMIFIPKKMRLLEKTMQAALQESMGGMTIVGGIEISQELSSMADVFFL